jgi:glycosyltransferase involved in cell wall biosynthesis
MFQRSGLPSHILRVIPFGIDCLELDQSKRDIRKEFHIPTKMKVFGYVGADVSMFAIQLVFDLFVEIFSRESIFERGKKEVLLLFVIPDESKAKVTQAMMDHPRVRIVNKNGTDIRDLYRTIDIYVHPFGSEWSMAPVEVLAFGKVVITAFRGIMSDYLTETQFSQLVIYPQQRVCFDAPCQGKFICQVPISSNGTLGCEELVKEPTFFEAHYRRLKSRMEKAFTHPHTDIVESGAGARNLVCGSYQWANISTIVAYELQRSVQNLQRLGNVWSDESALPGMIDMQYAPEAMP